MATLSIKVNQDCQLVNNDDRVALKNKYTMMTIIGIKNSPDVRRRYTRRQRHGVGQAQPYPQSLNAAGGPSG